MTKILFFSKEKEKGKKRRIRENDGRNCKERKKEREREISQIGAIDISFSFFFFSASLVSLFTLQASPPTFLLYFHHSNYGPHIICFDFQTSK